VTPMKIVVSWARAATARARQITESKRLTMARTRVESSHQVTGFARIARRLPGKPVFSVYLYFALF